MKVAINGTGVAGPALAYWLRRFGHQPVLYERAPAPRTGGYVIDFWGKGYDLAERMGILGEIRDRGYAVDTLKMMDAAGRPTSTLHVDPLRARLRDRFVSVARSDLASAVLGACEGVPSHFGLWIEGLTQDSDGVDVALSNGRTERFDLVVGADGLHSGIRSLAFGPQTQAEQPLGCVVAAYRLPGYPHRDELTYLTHTVTKRQAARFSLRDDDTLALLVCREDVLDPEVLSAGATQAQQKDALRRAFAGMGWETPDLLAGMSAAEDFYIDRVSQIHLDSWSSGRVALVGDAAACASLLAGEGTGLAMIESYVLAGELHRHGSDIAAGLRAYEDRLRAFITKKQRSALRMRGFFAPRTTLGAIVRDLGLRIAAIPSVTGAVLGGLTDDIDLPRYATDGR